jgi:hypothetical protein
VRSLASDAVITVDAPRRPQPTGGGARLLPNPDDVHDRASHRVHVRAHDASAVTVIANPPLSLASEARARACAARTPPSVVVTVSS